MGRLIDADRLIEKLKESFHGEMFVLADSVIRNIERFDADYDVDKVLEELEEITEFLKDCTKYGNKNAEQQKKSYDTMMMMYEVADLVDDLLDIVRKGGVE